MTTNRSSGASLTTKVWVSDDSPSIPQVLAVTILGHPDLRRVGERFLPTLDKFPLSRLEGRFSPPDQHTSPTALNDAGISRTPVFFERISEGIRFSTGEYRGQVDVDGVPVQSQCCIPADRLTLGAVVAFRGTGLVLLLHEIPMPTTRLDPLEMIGENPRMDYVRQQILSISRSNDPVLIRGETGVGKELVARALHAQSGRESYQVINMAGIADMTWLSDELFGHVKGAFTGANTNRDGALKTVGAGTLFLDEIGALPAAVQSGLLRVVQFGTYRPLGSDREIVFRGRLIAATDAALEKKIISGEFTSALYHRLSAHEIHVPALRDRRDDIARIIVHLLKNEFRDRLRRESRSAVSEPMPLPPMRTAMLAKLVMYPWPGNVRELKNAVTEIVCHSEGADRLRLPPEWEEKLANAQSISVINHNVSMKLPEPPVVPEVPKRSPHTRETLVDVLRRCGCNYKNAADELDISRNYLYSRMKHYNIRLAKEYTRTEIEQALKTYHWDVGATAEHLLVSVKMLRERIDELHLHVPD